MTKKTENLIKQGESQNIEFKDSLSLKREIGETVSAFSNTNGGTILIGVSDFGEIIGIEVGKMTLEDLANYMKMHTDPQIYPEINLCPVGDKNIIEVKVKENEEKPVFFKNHAFKRVSRTNQRISTSEMRRLAKEERKRLSFDEQICEEASLEDIDEEKVRNFFKKARYERRLDLDPDISAKETLEKLGMLKEEKITNAAILLFGKNPQKYFLQAETRCARFKGTKPLEFIDMKVFKGNIIDQREDALEFVKEHIKLQAKIVGTERVERWEYPIEAIREAISNAICHRDYKIKSNVQVRIFDDRIEIWGCGLLPEPLTPEDLKKKHRSILRNPLIGKSFFLIKFIEEWGTGTNRIIEWCLKYGLPEPIFEEASGSIVVTLKKYKISDEDLEKLNERQRKAVEYLLKHKRITNKEYREINPYITDRTALTDLNDLVKKDIIAAKGEKKYRHYTLR
jgi:ATP-dependent DNA helicase RecG